MKIKKISAFILSGMMLFSATNCGKKENQKEIRVYTSFFGARGNEISSDNEIQQLIA